MKTLTKNIILFFLFIVSLIFISKISVVNAQSCSGTNPCTKTIKGYPVATMCVKFEPTVNVANLPAGKNVYLACDGDYGEGFVRNKQPSTTATDASIACGGTYCSGYVGSGYDGGCAGQNWCEGEIVKAITGSSTTPYSGIVSVPPLIHCSCSTATANPDGSKSPNLGCLQVSISSTPPTMANACNNYNPTVTGVTHDEQDGCTVTHNPTLACGTNGKPFPDTITINCPAPAPLPPPPVGPAPSAPTLGDGSCSGTTANISWTNGTGATQSYYCDQTKAAAAGGCKPDDGSIDSSRWFYRPPGNSVSNDTSPLTFSGLTAGDTYQWLVAGTNASGARINSAIGTFTCPAASTCTPNTTCKANSGTCGAGTTTTCSSTGVASNPACSITCPPTNNKPAAPVLGEATCDVSAPTTETLSWTNGTGATQSYYCDQTKAAAAGGCKPDDESIDSSRWFYRTVGNSITNDTSPLTFNGTAGPPGLTAGDDYQWLVAAADENGHTNSNIGTFTAGSCGGGPQPGLALVIGLDGIGTTGDQVNADWTTKTNTAIINGQPVTNLVAGSNQDPKTPTRLVTLTLTGNGDNPITVTGNVIFATDGANVGKYTGTIPYGTTVKAGTYTVKVAVDGHLTKLVPGTVTVADTNTTATVARVDLVTGDINGDNALTSTLTISDYNILLSCISDSDYRDVDGHALCNQNENYKARADLEDNGAWDKFDYNLFLREFKMIQAGD